MRVLVTGASGFVGGAVARRLSAGGAFEVRGSIRRHIRLPGDVEAVRVPPLAIDTDWRAAVRGVNVVVHAAARVHVLRERASDPLAAFRSANVAGTIALARQAAEAGVRRFIFLSSIKVNGEETPPGIPFTADDPPNPRDAYAISKREAEQSLRELAATTGLEVVIIRPVLVYGPGVRANFRALLRALHLGVPLPLGAVDNRRSLVAIDNLTDLVERCLTHPAAANRTFLVSDDEVLSTPELLRRAAIALGTRARLVPVPPTLLESLARVAGRGDMARRLCRSLAVDIGMTRSVLDWSPPVQIHVALARTAAEFLAADA